MTEPMQVAIGDQDKITEEQMALRLGTTVRALQTRRFRKQIPMGVWNKDGRRIIYSIRRYEEWLESQWICPQGWNSSANRFESVSRGKEAAVVKRSPIPRHKKASQLHPSFAIR